MEEGRGRRMRVLNVLLVNGQLLKFNQPGACITEVHNTITILDNASTVLGIIKRKEVSGWWFEEEKEEGGKGWESEQNTHLSATGKAVAT